MSRGPVLAYKTFAAGHFDGERVPMTMTVHGGLHMLRGNSAPYFSLTYWAHRAGFPNQCVRGGAGYELIARKFGHRFDDLVALHLCDIDGIPMHALENGWYHLGFTSWQAFDAVIVAHHFRITETDARQMRATLEPLAESDTAEGKAALATWINSQRERWADEAKACIAHHGLVVFGDPWPIT